MRKYSLYISVIIILTLRCTVCMAQKDESLPINLETVLRLAGANNLTVKEYELRYSLSLAEQTKAAEWWLPTVYAGYTTHLLNGAAMNTDGKIFTGVKQNNLWAGTGVFATIDFGSIYRSLAAKQSAQAASYFSKEEKNQAILHAVQAYFDLQAWQMKYLFMQGMVGQADTLSQQIKIKVDAGLLYQSDYLLAQSNYEHMQVSVLQAKVEWQKKSAELAALLNLDNGTTPISADTALVPVSMDEPPPAADGYRNRSAFAGLSLQLRSAETLRKTQYAGLLLPTLQVGAGNGAFGAYGTSLYNTWHMNASLLWSLPLASLSTKGDLKKYDAQIRLRQNAIEQFRNQYRKETATALSQAETAKEQMTHARAALKASATALAQGIAREKLGTARPFEVFQSEQFYQQAQAEYVQAVSEYNKAQFALKVAVGGVL